MELSYDKLFTCTSANCVGRACRHQQAHSDSCISIDNPDAPLEVGDVITHRRSFHPGVVVAVPQDPPNRVFIHFDRQNGDENKLINRRECKKRPRVHYALPHQRRHIKFILDRFTEVHSTLDHREPGQHYQKVCFYILSLLSNRISNDVCA